MSVAEARTAPIVRLIAEVETGEEEAMANDDETWELSPDWQGAVVFMVSFVVNSVRKLSDWDLRLSNVGRIM